MATRLEHVSFVGQPRGGRAAAPGGPRDGAIGSRLPLLEEPVTQPPYPQATPIGPAPLGVGVDARVSAFLRSVYGWMFVGLAVTAGTASAVTASPAVSGALLANRLLFFGLLIGELGLVVALSARVRSMAPATAAALFLVYSLLNGVTLSLVLLAYTGASVANAFFVSAGMFGALAVYGTTTQRSLAGWGSFLFMGLVGVVIAALVGIFWHNDTLQFVIGVVGVIVFTGLAAYDAQRLKAMALAVPEGRVGAYAITGALSLYLDFVNLFLSLLRLMGNRR
jgi:FtsH-binding integral membrane protein